MSVSFVKKASIGSTTFLQMYYLFCGRELEAIDIGRSFKEWMRAVSWKRKLNFQRTGESHIKHYDNKFYKLQSMKKKRGIRTIGQKVRQYLCTRRQADQHLHIVERVKSMGENSRYRSDKSKESKNESKYVTLTFHHAYHYINIHPYISKDVPKIHDPMFHLKIS